MPSELLELGEKLKVKRKELNLSIKEVESSTSIRSNYITAIENGDAQNLLSPVYIQGFIKQYAAFLGLDGDNLLAVAKFDDLGKKPSFLYGLGPVERRSSVGGLKWMPILKWSSAIAFILTSLYLFAKFMDVV